MPILIALLACSSLLVAVPLAWGQPSETAPSEAVLRPSGSLTLISQPTGCAVLLRNGELIEGRTPLSLARGLTGRYHVVAHQDGYERWRRTVVLDGISADTLWIKLRPKSPLMAGVRSLLVPGWGQFYGDHEEKGWVVGALGAAAGITALAYELRYADRVDEYEEAQDRYRAATTLVEVEESYAAYRRAAERAEDAYKERRLWLLAGAAVWAINVADAVFTLEGPSEGGWSGVAGLRVDGSGGVAPALAVRRKF